MKWLSRKEELVLLTIRKLLDNAYGVTIREQLARVTGKHWSIGAIYDVLDRLVHKGYATPSVKPPLPGRSGRSRRTYTVTRKGFAAIEEVRRLNDTVESELLSPDVRPDES
jgi:DNA-binding PadR family transcriptional regulator